MIEPERLDYLLTADSLVWDVGAYRGEFAAAIYERFSPLIAVFEPVQMFSMGGSWLSRQVTAGSPGLYLHHFGLSDHDHESEIPLAGDRTTAYPTEAAMHLEYQPGAVQKVRMRDVVGFMDEHAITQVDLAKINIEGGEYPLLRRLIDSGYISRFRHLQVQFHTFIPEFGEKYMAIKNDLLRTHDLSWRWPWRWESWARK